MQYLVELNIFFLPSAQDLKNKALKKKALKERSQKKNHRRKPPACILLKPRSLAARDDQPLSWLKALVEPPHFCPLAVVPPATCWPVLVVP
jgi:hypothetical protein